MEKNTQPTVTRKNSNRVNPIENDDEISSLTSRSHRHHHRRQSHRRPSHRRSSHHHDRHRRHYSYSPCSTCSDRSRHDHHSDVGYHRHHHYQHQRSEPIEKIITPRTPRARTSQARTPSPLKRTTAIYRDAGIGTGLETKIMKDSGVTADLEDVPSR